jgi:hypothetical protein
MNNGYPDYLRWKMIRETEAFLTQRVRCLSLGTYTHGTIAQVSTANDTTQVMIIADVSRPPLTRGDWRVHVAG